tara:strand:- start:897 stop:1271 length:375 start_codon:yes stop_codon:yes gene_type:complete
VRELQDFIDKADKFLETAQQALQTGDCDSCVSRCYYAMFFTAEAVLLTRDLRASSHKGVISLFGEHFVKTGIFKKEFGKALNDAWDLRLIGDYGVGVTIKKKEAEGLLETARYFVQTISDFLQV